MIKKMMSKIILIERLMNKVQQATLTRSFLQQKAQMTGHFTKVSL